MQKKSKNEEDIGKYIDAEEEVEKIILNENFSDHDHLDNKILKRQR